jgi:diguanylate cyclase (GGDEF)-like protein
MRFRYRLASFLVLALVTVQALTGVLVYAVTRQQALVQGERELGASTVAFRRQLDDMADRVAGSVRILALDYALRSAIAQRDEATVLSALANHGRRVGATRMQLVGLDGRVQADTLPGAGHAPFGYPDLLERSFDKPASAVVAWRGQANWVVAVPVFAPDLVGVIAATLPVDRPLLARLQAQSVLPRSIELASAGPGGWTVLAKGEHSDSLTPALGRIDSRPQGTRAVRVNGKEFIVQAVWLNQARGSEPVAAVLGYSVDEALAPYRPVAIAWAVLLALGLVAGVVAAFLIARRVSRPVEALAESARRIEAGDFDGPPVAAGKDEIGALASAFTSMTAAVREREARILHQAGHDLVTGLPNRASAEAGILRDQGQRPGDPDSLLMVGLRRMPEIVKTLGHGVVDRLMRDAGERLHRLTGGQGLARATDTEFSIFLPGQSEAAAIASAYRIVDALAAPYQESDLILDMAPAVGIAVASLDGDPAPVLLRRAGVALIAALAAEEPVAVYNPATDPHRPERLALMGELREALDRDQLELHYQPRLHLASGRIDGAEALVRWTHARLGKIPPDAFIALAEETGNIRRLTRWALATGIAQARRWQEADRPLCVSINLSARDVEDPQLPRRVAELLALHQVSPDRILLEVTESAVMAQPDAAIQTLHQLARQGIHLSIDDFGVGQSSFAYLRQLPVNELKIDKLFVQRIADAPADRSIVRSIVELGHQLGHHVTAEGVEDAATLEFLRGIGCDHAQGYYISAAQPAAALDRFLDDWAGASPRRAPDPAGASP